MRCSNCLAEANECSLHETADDYADGSVYCNKCGNQIALFVYICEGPFFDEGTS
jgi:hypothetical protein